MRKRSVDVVAEDHWAYTDASGECVVMHVWVGRPIPASDDPEGEWICRVGAEGVTARKGAAMVGVGPVDALVNAAGLLKTIMEERRVAPRALP